MKTPLRITLNKSKTNLSDNKYPQTKIKNLPKIKINKKESPFINKLTKIEINKPPLKPPSLLDNKNQKSPKQKRKRKIPTFKR